MATGANIKQGNSRGSSTIFLHLPGTGSSCSCTGSTLLQTPATTTHHSSTSANFETKWGKGELLAASSIFSLIKLYCLRKGDRTELAHVPQSSSDGWRILSEVLSPIDECHKLTFHQDSVGIKWVTEQQLLHQL